MADDRWAELRQHIESARPWIDPMAHELLRELEADDDSRDHIYVHADHNPDAIRTFYEVPEALARRVQPEDDPRTFAQALADRLAFDDEAGRP